MADIVEIDLAQQRAVGGTDRKVQAFAVGHHLQHVSERHFRVENRASLVDHIVEIHQSNHTLVLMVREQVPLPRQTHGINAVRFDASHRDVAHSRDNHERNQELIAAGQLSNEENPREGGMKHGAHHSGHAVEARIGGGHHQTEGLYPVPHPGKNIAGETSQENRGSKRTTAPASASRSGGRENFDQGNEGNEQQQVVVMSVEKRIVQHRCRFRRAGIADQDPHHVVSLSVERRKKEDEQRQHGGSQGITHHEILARREDTFESNHGSGEIER